MHEFHLEHRLTFWYRDFVQYQVSICEIQTQIITTACLKLLIFFLKINTRLILVLLYVPLQQTLMEQICRTKYMHFDRIHNSEDNIQYFENVCHS